MMFSQLHLVRLAALTAVCSIASIVGTSYAQDSEFNEDLDKELEGVTIIEHLDEQLPLDLEFTDEDGKTIALGDLFGDRPVILQMGYFRCPCFATWFLMRQWQGLRV